MSDEGTCFVCGKKGLVGKICDNCAEAEKQDEIREEERERERIYEQEEEEEAEEF